MPLTFGNFHKLFKINLYSLLWSDIFLNVCRLMRYSYAGRHWLTNSAGLVHSNERLLACRH